MENMEFLKAMLVDMNANMELLKAMQQKMDDNQERLEANRKDDRKELKEITPTRQRRAHV
jgi:predicted  nucleic acid-binding Zn-ribbon protein